MEIRSLILIVIAAVVAMFVLRVVLSAIKTSAKLIMWAAIAVITFGGGFLWYQNQQGADRLDLPVLSIPSEREPAPDSNW